ncbi:hypothetical protein ACFL6X_03090 [Candidatus Latescibacterota bacterium]
MIFGMGGIDEARIEKLWIPTHNMPETHVQSLLDPAVLDLPGDRDEGNPSLHDGVDIQDACWLMHSSRDKMVAFCKRAHMLCRSETGGITEAAS